MAYLPVKSQSIELLKKQIEKLEAEDFDLEAWKTGAVIVLQRIFGETDPRTKQIDQLKIDYSSWMLRDSNSKYRPLETAKRKGREIMATAIEEIEIIGVPENHSPDKPGTELQKELREMDEKDRKKYFEGFKKVELIRLLMTLTA